MTIRGNAEACTRARLALDMLYGRLQEGHELVPGDVEGAIDVMRLAHSSLDLFETRADTLRSSYPRSQAP